MKDKYYTPTTEEFYIGFECEIYDDDDKTWDIVYVDTQPALCDITGLHLDIRVKYLDRSDIEDLGFTIKTTSYGIYYIKGEYKIEYSWNKKLIISQQNKLLKTESFENEGNILFIGDVKNKSELKVLLKQLNIL